MVNLAWGGYGNGRIPVDHLTEFMPGYRLESTAAAQFMRMRQACYNATGHWISPAPQYDIPSSYRDLPAQQIAWNLYQSGRGNIAAYPGSSNHGWARAIDLTGYETTSNGVWAWLQAHAAEYGYSNATGAATGTPPGERWHWECLTAPGTTVAGGNATSIINRTDDDEMLSKEAQEWMTTTFATKSDVRRENRGRLFYCPNPPAGLPNFVVIFLNRNPGAANILYCNAGESQAANWANLYGQTADSVAQAKAVPDSPEQFRTRINLALGVDSAFKNAAAK